MIEKICIIGVGLIGSSLAKALKNTGQVKFICGYGRDAARLEKASRPWCAAHNDEVPCWHNNEASHGVVFDGPVALSLILDRSHKGLRLLGIRKHGHLFDEIGAWRFCDWAPCYCVGARRTNNNNKKQAKTVRKKNHK